MIRYRISVTLKWPRTFVSLLCLLYVYFWREQTDSGTFYCRLFLCNGRLIYDLHILCQRASVEFSRTPSTELSLPTIFIDFAAVSIVNLHPLFACISCSLFLCVCLVQAFLKTWRHGGESLRPRRRRRIRRQTGKAFLIWYSEN